LIKAPAGFGKTSLAAAWSQELQQSRNAVGWLTIDPDDEPATFIFYLCHALQRVRNTVGTAAIDLIRERFLLDSRAMSSTLVNDLADVDDEIYLTLEDYHWIINPDVHDALSFFLKHAPSNCHVVLTSRAEPPLPLVSLLEQNILWKIDALALRYDLREIRYFIEVERPGTLSPSDVRLLHEKTEGWPAALRIVTSTSLQLDQDFGQYVHNLSGVQRPIGAYFEEMLDGLPHDMVQFMLRTAVLNRICAPLCDGCHWSEPRPGVNSLNRATSIAACAPRSGRSLVSPPLAPRGVFEPEARFGAWQRDIWSASASIPLVCRARVMDGGRATCVRGGRCSPSAWLDQELRDALGKKGGLFYLAWLATSFFQLDSLCVASQKSGLRSLGAWRSLSDMTSHSRCSAK
jgi:hypothetical protein